MLRWPTTTVAIWAKRASTKTDSCWMRSWISLMSGAGWAVAKVGVLRTRQDGYGGTSWDRVSVPLVRCGPERLS